MDDFGDDPDDLAEWGLHCFCLGARSTPHHVVKMDDNGRILFRVRLGISRTELRHCGIDPSDSQVALLRAYDLIAVEGERLVTTFPVLGSEETAGLRTRMAGLAEAVASEIAVDVSGLARVLPGQGLAGCVYGVLFGYVIDGLIWDRLRSDGLLPSVELSVERPYWNGAFWAVYPPREGAMGTNEIEESGVRLTMVWTEETVWSLNRLAPSGGGPRGRGRGGVDARRRRGEADDSDHQATGLRSVHRIGCGSQGKSSPRCREICRRPVRSWRRTS